jgi:hypothetical protein
MDTEFIYPNSKDSSFADSNPMTFSSKQKLKKLGFTESLNINPNKSTTKKNINPNMCPSIFLKNNDVNTSYYYPSEFPNLTKIKSIPIIKKGGKRTYKRIKKNKSKKRKY